MTARSTIVSRLVVAISAWVLLGSNVSAALPDHPSAPGFGHDRDTCPPAPIDRDLIDRLIIRDMAALHVPGMSVAILQRGKAPIARSYGYADLESCVPATTGTLFGIGSLSKQFTAVGALLLVREGRLSLDDPITKYLPEGRGKWDDVRIRNLLTHTSGIPDYADDDTKYPILKLDRGSSPTTTALISQIANAPVNFRPGDDWAYSNTGYLLLSAIIERASKQPFPAFMHNHVFAPLGMASTRYYSPIEFIPHRGTPYHQDAQGVVTHGPFISDQFSRGDAGIITTATDMRRWLMALGSDNLLPESLWALMFKPVVLNDGTAFPYGFGIQLNQVADQLSWTHTGTFRPGYSAMLVKFPERGLAVAALSNSYTDGPFPMAQIVKDIVGAEAPELEPASMRKPLADPHPEFTAALLKMLEGNKASEGAAEMTTRFDRHDPAHVPIAAELAHMPPQSIQLQFLGCAPARGSPPAALGTPVNRECVYRPRGAPRAPGILFWLTSDNRVAGLSFW